MTDTPVDPQRCPLCGAANQCTLANPATATLEMATLGAVFMILTFAIFVLYGCFAAAARTYILGSDAVLRWLNRGFAAIFAGLAARLAAERA